VSKICEIEWKRGRPLGGLFESWSGRPLVALMNGRPDPGAERALFPKRPHVAGSGFEIFEDASVLVCGEWKAALCAVHLTELFFFIGFDADDRVRRLAGRTMELLCHETSMHDVVWCSRRHEQGAFAHQILLPIIPLAK
jgi:hypothetical protein